MYIIPVIYFLLFFFAFRYVRILQIKDLSKWSMSLAFTIKIAMGLVFSYVYIYSIKPGEEPSDAIRFLNESKQLYRVFFTSPGDFFALLTGIGDNARMIHEHMDKTFIWDAGNFTTINDSRNTIRVHCLIHFISFGSGFVHTIIMCALSLIGLQQLYLSIQPYSKLKPILLFSALLLFPSLLFWSSSILKEPLLLLGIGLLSRAMLLHGNKKKRFLLGGFGIMLLIGFKPYIFMCLIPAIAFYLAYKHVFRYRLIITLVSFFAVAIFGVICFPKQRQSITENLSRKQFDVENVGNGGIHVTCKNGYYYFKPDQYKNLKIKNGTVELIDTSDAIFLSVDTRELPEEILLTPNDEKWPIHIIMPGTNSYIKTTPINNSFPQLIKNIPEALMNSFFRPFPFDKGSILMYPSMFEVWTLTFFLILAFFKRRKMNLKTRGIIAGLLIFSICLLLLIGWTTPVAGAIARFRFPAQLALLIVGTMLIDVPKLSKKKSHE